MTEETDAQMLQTAEIRRAGTAAEIIDADRQQRQPHCHDHQRSDDRRKQLAQRPAVKNPSTISNSEPTMLGAHQRPSSQKRNR